MTWTNGKITLTMCLVFGLSVLSETGYIPYSQLDARDKDLVKKFIDYDPSFPWADKL
jgi:hypothetical protein